MWAWEETVKKIMILVVMVLSMVVSGFGQRIHGHVIGESGADFLKTEPEVQVQLDTCIKDPGLDLKMQIEPFGHDVFCKGLTEVFVDKRGEHDVYGFANAPGGDGKDIRFPYTLFKFKNGSLVEYSFSAGPFSEVRNELSKRLGFAPVSGSGTYQNGFGARWVNHHAVWKNGKVFVVLYEDNDPTGHDISVTVKTRAWHDAEEAAKHNRSPLD